MAMELSKLKFYTDTERLSLDSLEHLRYVIFTFNTFVMLISFQFYYVNFTTNLIGFRQF